VATVIEENDDVPDLLIMVARGRHGEMLKQTPILPVATTVPGNVKIATLIVPRSVSGPGTAETEETEQKEEQKEERKEEQKEERDRKEETGRKEVTEAIEVIGGDETLNLNAQEDVTGIEIKIETETSSMTGHDVAIVNRERNEKVLRPLERRSQLLI
jgi:hypothetical protein